MSDHDLDLLPEDELTLLLRSARAREIRRVAATLHVPPERLAAYQSRPNLRDLAPWFRRAIADALRASEAAGRT